MYQYKQSVSKYTLGQKKHHNCDVRSVRTCRDKIYHVQGFRDKRHYMYITTRQM